MIECRTEVLLEDVPVGAGDPQALVGHSERPPRVGARPAGLLAEQLEQALALAQVAVHRVPAEEPRELRVRERGSLEPGKIADMVILSGNPLKAVTYIAQGNEVDGRPSLRYITLLLDGARAHNLPEHYLQFLEAVEHAQ